MADAATWKKHVAAWRASGETAAAYCEQHGLGLSTLRYWTRKAGREAVTATDRIRLARVERVAASEASTDAVATAAVVIEVGGARVRVERVERPRASPSSWSSSSRWMMGSAVCRVGVVHVSIGRS